MAMNDVWDDDAFSLVGLTASINKLPFVPGEVGKTGIFEEDGVRTTTVIVEEKGGKLALVGTSARGGPGESVDKDYGDAKSFVVPHYQRDDTVKADEVQNVRAFGTENGLMTVQNLVDQRMASHTRAFDAPLEHQRVGALKGLVVDKNSRVVLDTYGAYGLTAPAPFQFQFSSPTFDVREESFNVMLAIEDALDGDVMGDVHAFVGSTFWSSLISHPSVEKTYLNWLQAAELRGGMMKDVFFFGDVYWHRYRTGKQATASAGNAFIGASEARFAVKGVPELFITRFAPADYEETVNTVGLPRYAKQMPTRNGKGRDLEMQMNAISLCTRPETLQSAQAS